MSDHKNGPFGLSRAERAHLLATFSTLPIPPLEPTHLVHRDIYGYEDWREMERAMGTEVIFRMRLHEYQERMLHESKRLEREQHMTEQLRAKTGMIADLQDQVKQLQTTRTPTVSQLRQAYAEDIIDLEEFDRLVLHCIAGSS